MDQTTDMLSKISEGAEMGIETTDRILKIIEDQEFTQFLNHQLEEYTEIHKQAQSKKQDFGETEKEISAFQKWMSDRMIDMKTMTDKSASHIAEMMLQGSVMGIIQIQRAINQLSKADPEICALAQKLLRTEENNIQQLKTFL